MTLAMNTGGSAGLTACAGSGVSVLWSCRLAIKLIARGIAAAGLSAAMSWCWCTRPPGAR